MKDYRQKRGVMRLQKNSKIRDVISYAKFCCTFRVLFNEINI